MDGWPGEAVARFVASGHAVDLVLAVLVAEAVVLALLWHRRRRGVAPADIVVNLLSGGCLLGALRAGLTGGWWGWIVLLLIGAGGAHLIDLRRRWAKHA